MLIVLMVFCAAGAVFLIGLGAYAEFRELWTHPDHRFVGGSSHPAPRPHSGPIHRF